MGDGSPETSKWLLERETKNECENISPFSIKLEGDCFDLYMSLF